MAKFLWLLPLLSCISCRSEAPCDNGCSHDEVEELEAQISSLELIQLSLKTNQPEPSLIGCAGGDKPVSMSCNNGSCTYRCKPDQALQELVCGEKQVIGMDACSGAGCSWSCKNILGCSESPKMMGCDRMAPPFNKCRSGLHGA
eukprot:g17822.t1